MPLRAGDTFARYSIVAPLGEGGMGVVYEARDTVLKRQVALKILKREAADDAKRLIAEARAAAAISHPNAVAIFDVGEADGLAYIAMELVQGKTLRAAVREGDVPLERRAAWLLDVAKALAAAHKQGVVHRDIKPENAIVRPDGVVKVLDFGIARRTTQVVAPTDGSAPADWPETVTRDDVIVGTPRYMAPEQLRGEHVDGAIDQFAWGVVAYEILGGALPWGEAVGTKLVSKILESEPAPPGISPEIDAVVMRALSKSRGARFPSMDELIAAMSVAVAHREPAPAPPRRVPRWPIAAGLGVVAAVALGIAVRAAREDAPSAASAPTTSAPSPASSAPASPPDYGSTMSANPRALAAYNAGVQAYRDAARALARERFEDATRLDPTFAAAHLRRALAFVSPDDVSREHLQKAMQLRDALSDHDRALLEAIEPWFRVPPDSRELARRLDALEQSSPDGDALYLVCVLRGELDDYARSIDACAAAAKVDVSAAAPHRGEAINRIALDDVPGAMAALDECLRLAPSSSSCLLDLGWLASEEGKCPEALALARRLVTVDPTSAMWLRNLATALHGAGESTDTVREALQRYLDRVRASERPKEEARAFALFAAARGDFVTARQRLDDWRRAVSSSTDELEHKRLLELEADVDFEMGRPDDAVAAARAYERRRSAWTPEPYIDAGILPLEILRRAGRLSSGELEAQRAEWLALRHGAPPGEIWIVGYARLVIDERDARAALDVLPRFTPLPGARTRSPAEDEPVGHAYLVSGQAESALPFLERAAHACSGLEQPLRVTQASYELAEARAATHDQPGACAAIADVLARWGRAKPASVTAARARALAGRLRCED